MSVRRAPHTVGFRRIRTQLKPFNAAKLFFRLIPASEQEKLGTEKRFHDDDERDDYYNQIKELKAICESLSQTLKADSYAVNIDAVIVTGNPNTGVEGNEDETRTPLSSSSAMLPRDSLEEGSDLHLQKAREESSGRRAPRITGFRIQFKLLNAAKLNSTLSPERKKDLYHDSGLIEKMCEDIRDLTEECLACQRKRVEELDIGLSNACIGGDLDEPQSSEEGRALTEELLEIQRDTVNIRTMCAALLRLSRLTLYRYQYRSDSDDGACCCCNMAH
ncbi:hypothetical protein R3P38DRAFT_514209 [Favolaschia claudopus]|uniref:Uncharacterized protein n=1 Tax=Favolaschia claudopus TaxID=2862362 RepID=A0AAV9ZBT9_9AGAR